MEAAESPESSDAAPPRPLSERVNPRRMVRLGFAFACVPTCVAWLARRHWVFDLATPFAMQSAVLMAIFLAVFLFWRSWIPAGIAGLGLLLNLALILPIYFGRPTTNSDGPRLKILTANVHTGNRNSLAFLELVERENPDIVVTVEVDDRWLRELQPLRERYPHFVEKGRFDNFGIALYTRLPSAGIHATELADSEVPTLVARLGFEGRKITVIAAHTLPPVSGEYSGLRNRHLAALAKLASEEVAPTIVAGDLNITSWSPWFQDLLENSRLRDTRQGLGIQPTWPTSSPLIRIPIDHVLVSDGIGIIDRRVGGHFGSDHFPVLVELTIPGVGKVAEPSPTEKPSE